MSETGNITVLACSVFRPIFEVLQPTLDPSIGEIQYLDSMLHMYPEKLAKQLQEAENKIIRKGGKVLLVYGDCHPHIREESMHQGVTKITGLNCCHILLGNESYWRNIQEGTFFLLPEWLERWDEIMEVELGFDADSAASFMKEMHSKFVYLSLENAPVPQRKLEQLSEKYGLPWHHVAIGLEIFSKELKDAVARLRNEK